MDIFYASLLPLFVIALSCLLRFAFFPSDPAVDGKLPPGRRGWPLIGETIEFLTSGWKGHPEKFILDRMTKYSHHVFRTSLILEDVAVLCGQAGNKFLFTNENKLVQQWLPSSVGKIFYFSDEDGRKMKMIQKYILKPEALQKYVPIMDVVTQKHFETVWEGKDQIHAFKLIQSFTLLVPCKIFFSIDDPEWVNKLCDKFSTLATGIFSIPVNLPGSPLRRAIDAATFIRKEFTAVIKQRRTDLADGKDLPTPDILSLMLCEDTGKSMTDAEIADLIMAMLIGGQDSTSSTCTFIVKYLAELPKIYDGVYREQMEIAKTKASKELLNWEDMSKMRYSWNVACEVLRLVSPTQGTFREVISDFTYNGYSIPKGWKLYWSTNSTHKNPNYFLEPEKFNPSRFDKGPTPYTFVPFGGGRHVCPGKEFVRMEILVFMHHLVTKFKFKKLIPDEKITFNPVPKLAKGLPIRLYPHNIYNP